MYNLSLCVDLLASWTGFANVIDGWSQFDFFFTNFGVILEYLESSMTTKKPFSDFLARGPGMNTLSWGIHEVAVVVRWPGKLKSMMAVIE